MTQWTKGRARIYIPYGLAPENIQEPKYGYLSWNAAEVQGVFDLWASHLQLPEQYTIIACYFDGTLQRWVVIVESEDIPLPKQNEDIPGLYPAFESDESTGKFRVVPGDLTLSKY